MGINEDYKEQNPPTLNLNQNNSLNNGNKFYNSK